MLQLLITIILAIFMTNERRVIKLSLVISVLTFIPMAVGVGGKEAISVGVMIIVCPMMAYFIFTLKIVCRRFKRSYHRVKEREEAKAAEKAKPVN